MTFVSRLVDILTGSLPEGGGSHPLAALPPDRLATAALLVHVARVDGIVAAEERTAIGAFLRDGFGVAAEDVEALIGQADRMDREVDDVAELIEMMGHERDADEKRGLLATAYRVAAADGRVREFENDLVWRMGRLLGFGDGEITVVRGEVLGEAGG